MVQEISLELQEPWQSGKLKTVFQGYAPTYRGKSCKQHSESIRQAPHHTAKCGLLPSWPQQKHPELLELCLMLPKYCKTFDSPKYYEL